MPNSKIRDKLLSDHRKLRAKAAIVATLALDVLRGDEDLASALRLKGEELNAHLLDHMLWEERQLVPLLVKSASGEPTGLHIVEEHADQRLRLADSLTELQLPNASFAKLAKECIKFVRWLETDMASEERHVLGSLALAKPADSQ